MTATRLPEIFVIVAASVLANLAENAMLVAALYANGSIHKT